MPHLLSESPSQTSEDIWVSSTSKKDSTPHELHLLKYDTQCWGISLPFYVTLYFYSYFYNKKNLINKLINKNELLDETNGSSYMTPYTKWAFSSSNKEASKLQTSLFEA